MAVPAYLTLQAVWRNPGPVAVNVCLDPEHSFVKQFELGADPPLGSFRMAGYPGAVEVAAVPMLPRPYTMGPQTESVMTEHFVVTVGSVYAFIWQVCQGPLSRKNQRHAQCDRELIWCSPPPATARTSRARPRIRTELPRATRPAARRKPTPSAPAGTGVSGGPVAGQYGATAGSSAVLAPMRAGGHQAVAIAAGRRRVRLRPFSRRREPGGRTARRRARPRS